MQILLIGHNERIKVALSSLLQNEHKVAVTVFPVLRNEENFGEFDRLVKWSDVIILDVSTVGINHEKCIQDIFSLNRSSRIIVVNDYAYDDVENIYLSMGADAYLSYTDLNEQVKNLVCYVDKKATL
jgi:DNA-binding NarL/FixJ family response regulator